MADQITELSPADRFAISDLYYNYSFAMDDHDPERVGSLFTEDATFEVTGRDTLVGRDAVIGLAKAAAAGGPGAYHILSGVVAAPAPFGATGRAYVQPMRYEESVVRFLAFSEYRDDLVRTVEGWRFQTRRYIVLNPAGLSGVVLGEV